MYNVRNTHQLIPREQTYVLDRKLVSIHSEDRDIKKWPHSNHFEVTLPEVMSNVESMRLLECTLPLDYYTFSNDYQNTKLSFKVSVIDPSSTYYQFLANANSKIFTITIQEGFYEPEELASEIQSKMNSAVTDFIKSYGGEIEYDSMRVFFDKVGQRYWFGNIHESFQLLFDRQEKYILKNCEQPNMWEKYTKWGLPSYLGFDRQSYKSQPSINSSDEPAPITFAYLGDSGIWMSPTSSVEPVYFIRALDAPYLLGERAIYMELKKYNNMDELKPFSERTNNVYNNDYNGNINAAFAKIPVLSKPLSDFSESKNSFLSNVVMFDVPEEKIAKLEVTFRYHDGRLVEFNNIPFNFTIEFNRLKNEIARSYTVRVPNTYNL